jgi:isoleucyl-tRNA synthetase
VLDTWHNSGSAPYSSFTDAEYRSLIPARFLTEGIDQTRGWAYTLLVMNVMMSGKPRAPYRAFLFQGHVLDDHGRKMSKSLGNVIWGLDLLRERSVDLVRFYLAWKSSPEDSLSMDLKEMSARPYQVLNTLYHLHVYLVQNGEVDGYDPRRHTLGWARKNDLLEDVDEWLLAKLRSLEKAATGGYDAARYNDACKAFEEAIIGQISQNYVRLVRGDLWRDDPKERNRRLAIYAILGHTLRRVDALLHPVIPFLTEYLYQETFAAMPRWATPLLVEGAAPTPATRKKGAEEKVEFALKVEDACNSARTKARLKRRWPLRSVKVLVRAGVAPTARRSSHLISSLCNVRKVDILTSAEEFPATFVLAPNTAKLGVLFKSSTRDVIKALDKVEGEVALERYLSAETVHVKLPTGDVEVPSTAFDLQVNPTAEFEVAERDGVFVAVDKKRDEKLVAEGLARDLARRLQTLRKARGFTPTKVLTAGIVAGLDDEELVLLGPLKKELAFLVRVKGVELMGEKSDGRDWAEDDLDGKPVYLDVF